MAEAISPEEKNVTDQSSSSDEDKDLNKSSSSSSDSSDSDGDFYCSLCDKFFSGIKPLAQHEKSGKHIKALKKKKLQKKIKDKLTNDESSDEENLIPRKDSYAFCEACEKEFSGPEPYIQHLKSKGHKKKLKEKKILDQVKVGDKIDAEKLKEILKQDETATKSEARNANSKKIWKCKDCDKVFSGMEPFSIHLNSKVHEQTLEQKTLQQKLEGESPDISSLESVENVLVCHLCKMSFSGPKSAFDHLKSRGHSKKLEIQAWKEAQKQTKTAIEEKEGSVKSEDSDLQKRSDDDEKNQNKLSLSADNSSDKDPEPTSEDDSKKTVKAYIQYKGYKKIMDKSNPAN